MSFFTITFYHFIEKQSKMFVKIRLTTETTKLVSVYSKVRKQILRTNNEFIVASYSFYKLNYFEYFCLSCLDIVCVRFKDE